MSKVIFFGTGLDAEKLETLVASLGENYKDHLIAYCDNNKAKWKTKRRGIPVVSPQMLGFFEYDFIIVTSRQYAFEIKFQLITVCNVPIEKIISFEEYRKKLFIQNEYVRNLERVQGQKAEHIYNTNKIVVYTAISGTYDELHNPEFIDEDITYVCFTDNFNLKSDTWNVEYVKFDGNPALAIREYKILPHKFFKNFDTSVWIDGSTKVKDDIRTYIKKYGKNAEMLCFPHPERNCIYDEAATVMLYKRAGVKECVEQQMHYLKDVNYPEKNGLYSCGCIVRNHSTEIIKKIMEDWWEEVNKFTKRDQISFPVVLHKNHYIVDMCDLDIDDNKWMEQKEHKV